METTKKDLEKLYLGVETWKTSLQTLGGTEYRNLKMINEKLKMKVMMINSATLGKPWRNHLITN